MDGARPPGPAFGTELASTMAMASFRDGAFGEVELRPLGPLALHPAAHGLHYGSACFEGLKAHRGSDGAVRLFRLDRHIERMRNSATVLCLPPPDTALLTEAIVGLVRACAHEVPEAPGALYLRPVLLGTEPGLGAAAKPSNEALLYVLASPVGEYFRAGGHGLRLAIETELPRTTPQFGAAKSGANYAMALNIIRRARAEHDADQVLFAPDGQVQETGAANFLLLDDHRIVTPELDGSFLAGITRDAILTLAADLGYAVEERTLTVEEVLDRSSSAEAALSGTAAVLAGVASIVHSGVEYTFGDGKMGPNTRRLREALVAVQRGQAVDRYGWTLEVQT